VPEVDQVCLFGLVPLNPCHSSLLGYWDLSFGKVKLKQLAEMSELTMVLLTSNS